MRRKSASFAKKPPKPPNVDRFGENTENSEKSLFPCFLCSPRNGSLPHVFHCFPQISQEMPFSYQSGGRNVTNSSERNPEPEPALSGYGGWYRENANKATFKSCPREEVRTEDPERDQEHRPLQRAGPVPRCGYAPDRGTRDVAGEESSGPGYRVRQRTPSAQAGYSLRRVFSRTPVSALWSRSKLRSWVGAASYSSQVRQVRRTSWLSCPRPRTQ